MSEIFDTMFFDLKGEYIHIQFLGDDNLVFETRKNVFKENTAITIENPQPQFPVYYFTLIDAGEHLLCGNIIDTLFSALLNRDIDNVILVLDFDGVLEVNESFCEDYFKNLLMTKNKVIPIRQNKQVHEIFSKYIIDNSKVLSLYEPEEEEEEEEEPDYY